MTTTYTTATSNAYLTSDGNGSYTWTDGVTSIPLSSITYSTSTTSRVRM